MYCNAAINLSLFFDQEDKDIITPTIYTKMAVTKTLCRREQPWSINTG
jgi:hypothetical protein